MNNIYLACYHGRADKWVVITKHGKPVDEHGNVIDEYLYY